MGNGFSEHQARMESADRAELLGRICWYTVRDSKIDHDELVQQMVDAGLDEFVPNAPKDDDVFRRVFRNGEREKITTPNPDIVDKLLVREVLRQDGEIVKHVVVERVDGAGKRLAYDEVVRVTFKAAMPERIEVVPLGNWHAESMALAGRLSADYRATRGTVDAMAVRAVVRGVIEAAKSTLVRQGGGVYFVPEAEYDKVAGLEQLAGVATNVSFVQLALPDTDKQRDMVKEAFENESIGDVDKAVAEITGLLRSGEKITPAKFAGYNARLQDIRQRSKEYTALLSRNLSGTEFKLDILGKQVAALLNSVQDGRSTAA